nr:FxDxF family PEP-CTERM protein [Methylibium rhizosphaerae]
MKQKLVAKKLLLAAGASVAMLAGTSAQALDVPCPVGIGLDQCYVGAVSGKKRNFSDWTIGDLSVETLSNVLGNFFTLGLDLKEVKIFDETNTYTDTKVADGVSFDNVAEGLYTVRISGLITGPKVYGHHYGAYAGGFNVTPVPEPETYALLLAGLLAVGYVARRRSQV